MRYVTHQFAHLETLERARRWLAQAGIDPGRIEARTHGIFSLSIAVEPGESAEVQRIIDAAEFSDPDGSPGMWDVVTEAPRHSSGRQEHCRVWKRHAFGVIRRRVAAPGCRPRSHADRHRASERVSGRQGLTNCRRRSIASFPEDALCRMPVTVCLETVSLAGHPGSG